MFAGNELIGSSALEKGDAPMGSYNVTLRLSETGTVTGVVGPEGTKSVDAWNREHQGSYSPVHTIDLPETMYRLQAASRYGWPAF